MNTYNTYDYNPEVGFIPSKCCDVSIDMDSIKNTIENTITNEMDDKFNDLKETINSNKEEIVDTIKDNKVCLCNIATKDDIKHAVHHINCHTDHRFDEIDFHCQFENLNNQIKKLQDNE